MSSLGSCSKILCMSPSFSRGFVSDLIVLYFCAARQSQRTPLVKNLNQIGESQQSSSPPLFGSTPLPPGQGNHQSRGATTKLFPEPISCWTVCYTLSNIPKIRLISKPALIWTPPPPPCLSPCREPHLQDWRFTLKGWDAGEQSRALPERERGPEQKKKKEKRKSAGGLTHFQWSIALAWAAQLLLVVREAASLGPAIHREARHQLCFQHCQPCLFLLSLLLLKQGAALGFSLGVPMQRCAWREWKAVGRKCSSQGGTSVPFKLRKARLCRLVLQRPLTVLWKEELSKGLRFHPPPLLSLLNYDVETEEEEKACSQDQLPMESRVIHKPHF